MVEKFFRLNLALGDYLRCGAEQRSVSKISIDIGELL